MVSMQHTRPHMPVRGFASASTARRLIAGAQGPAACILASTEVCEDYAAEVQLVPCRSTKLQLRCGVLLVPGQRYYMVRSAKFTSRWYVVAQNATTGEWVCSSKEAAVKKRCIAQVMQLKATWEAARAKAESEKPVSAPCSGSQALKACFTHYR